MKTKLNKINLFLFLLPLTLILPNCSENIDLPDDNSSLEQQQRFTASVSEIENTYKTFGIIQNFNRLSLIVPGPESSSEEDSQCLNSGVIVLNSNLFEKNANKFEISQLWLSVAKEIGRCLFLQPSYEKIISAPRFKKFRITLRRVLSDRVQCRYIYTKNINGTLMTRTPAREVFPESFKEYFLAEIAGLTSVNGNYQDLIDFNTGVDIVNNNTPENTNWFRCNN